MAEKGAQASNQRRRVSGKIRGDQYGDGALEGVAQQRRRGQSFAAGAQHVGRADIAGADAAYIGAAGGLRDQKPEWNRAEQIAEGKGQSDDDHWAHSAS